MLSESALCAAVEVVYKFSKCVNASRSVDITCNAFFTDLLLILLHFPANVPALSGGVIGRDSILSVVGGHIGIDGVKGVSKKPSFNVVIVILQHDETGLHVYSVNIEQRVSRLLTPEIW